MSKTYIPRILKSGGALLSGTRALCLKRVGNYWEVETSNGTLEAKTVFVCCGAIQTARLLLQSGIRDQVGQSFFLHPMLKVVAQFPEPVNFVDMGVPMHQVKLSEKLSLGCSVSSAPFLGVGLLDDLETYKQLENLWPMMASYYVGLKPSGTGSIRPVVRFGLSKDDRSALKEGFDTLAQLLNAAGATQIFSDHATLTSVHVMGTCPMGKATDMFGKVNNVPNLYISDASLFPGPIGVNPQGTIMALARRNALHYLDR